MDREIAIIGIGLHPFGRHEGVSAMRMGVEAAREALDDAGVAWGDVQFACAGSLEVTQPDSIIKFLGLTGIPFTSIFNGCATGGSCAILADAVDHRVITDCRVTGTGGQGEACADDITCAAGFACTGPAGGPTTCRRYCRIEPAPTACDVGLLCVPLGVGPNSTAAQIEATTYGVCAASG